MLFLDFLLHESCQKHLTDKGLSTSERVMIAKIINNMHMYLPATASSTVNYANTCIIYV